jgi:hypothetical protein
MILIRTLNVYGSKSSVIPEKKVYISAFYNPDSSHGLNSSIAKLNQKTRGKCDIWLAGDFNLKDINWKDQSVKVGSNIASQCRKCVEICNSFSLDPSNYGPISLTSVVCKLLEHVIHRHIMFHLERYNILSDSQHGFRKKRGCDTQLLITVNKIAKSIEKGKQIDGVLLDFSKAFDQVPHQRLLLKLKHYGITGNILTWISTFLTTRSQKVVLEGVSSTSANVISGVPQGTVLGPLLFLLYVNDIPSYVSSQTRLFADDGLLYREINTTSDAASLQKDLDSFCIWEKEWEMKFNVDKCFIVHMTTKKKPKIHNYNGKPLLATDNHPYLGLILSSDCKWSSHINKVTTSAKQTIGVIRRNFKSCSREVKSKLYQSLVRPKME